MVLVKNFNSTFYGYVQPSATVRGFRRKSGLALRRRQESRCRNYAAELFLGGISKKKEEIVQQAGRFQVVQRWGTVRKAGAAAPAALVTKRSRRPGSTFAVALLLYHSQHPTLPDHTARDGELFSEMLRHGFSTTPRAFILKSDHFRYLRGPV